MYAGKDFCPKRSGISSRCSAGRPAATRNFCALKICSRFSLEGVSRTNGVFDRAKLEWYNTQYLQKLPIEELLPEVERQLKQAGLWKEEWASRRRARVVLENRGSIAPARPACSRISPVGLAHFSATISIDPAAKAKFWKDEKIPALLARVGERSRPAGVESRCLRPCFAESGEDAERESGLADQRHARRHCRTSRGAAAVRHHGGARTGTGSVRRLAAIEQ